MYYAHLHARGTSVWDELKRHIHAALSHLSPRRVLIVPPDSTRITSGAGRITQYLYHMWQSNCTIVPATGSHAAMTAKERRAMFGAIPASQFRTHNWRYSLSHRGTIPPSLIAACAPPQDAPLNRAIEVNSVLFEQNWDYIVSIGQVVPHEVVGFSNYTKNILIGLGGHSLIETTHWLSACYGIENILGQIDNPIRTLVDTVVEHLSLPILYILVVPQIVNNSLQPGALYIGKERECFVAAAKYSAQHITYLPAPIPRAVVYLNTQEYRSLWLANKAIYRLRGALQEGGELIIIAPGVRCGTEDPVRNRLIARVGYRGAHAIHQQLPTNRDLADNLATAAHLIHGSPEGRFRVIYCTPPSFREYVEAVGYTWKELAWAKKTFLHAPPKSGVNIDLHGNEFYYVTHPGSGLWHYQRE